MKNYINKIIYTAGYIDGDGCFYVGKYIQNKNNVVTYEYSIQIVSVKIESLLFFKELFGGFIRARKQRINHKIPYVFTIKNKECIDLANQVKPFLKDKAKQCELFINMTNLIIPNKFNKINQIILDERNNIMERIKKNKHAEDFVSKEIIDSLKDTETIKPVEEDFAYVAGLIDAEGCFRIKKYKPKKRPNHVYSINLEIGNRRTPIFEFLISRFGGNISYSNETSTKNAFAIWSIGAHALFKLIPNIIPHLIIKRRAAEKLMEFYNTTLPNGGDRHSDKFKNLYREVLVNRERIVNEIHKLNLKGIKVK